jgi:twitching motility protein PilT
MEKALEMMLNEAVVKQASDIFITVGIPPTFKIDGVLVSQNAPALTQEDTEQLISSLFERQDQFEEYKRVGEKDFSISLSGVGRFRIDAYIQRGSMAAVIRVMQFEQVDPLVLGIPNAVLDLHKKTKGLILVTGPAGSGKSTTLSALISLINRSRSCHILTLEDPIEFIHKHERSIVDQREIGSDSRSYAHALRSALRQAPDVVLVGEMRDYETISIALTAAETGHLVLSTLHTVGAAKTIDRIVDAFPSDQQQQIRFQLSTVLQAVVSQQLIPAIQGGRAVAFEMMQVNHAIRNLIREAKIPQIEAAIQTGRSSGMVAMDMSLADLYNSGHITLEDTLLHCVNPDSIQKYFKRSE